MNLPIRGSSRRLRLAAASAVMIALSLASAGTAAATPSAANPKAPNASQQLNISMQEQQNDEWCWAASGNTIADFHGHGTDQNSFCDLATGRSTQVQCPNNPGQLSWDQRAFRALGVSPGTESGAISFTTVVSEINAGRPMETGISWTAGGGHAEVIYGYDQSSQSIYFGDPWPDDNRLNMSTYSYYVRNNQFTWNDTLYRIGA
jgi:hypothetical protein